MATKKKATTKKKSARAANTRKKTVSKKQQSDFWAVKFTAETLYWLIFGVLVVAIALWTSTTASQVNEIYDNMNEQDSTVIQAPAVKDD